MNHLGISLGISPFVTSKQSSPFFQPPRLSWKSLEPTYRPETDWSSFFLIHEWIYGRYIGIFTYKWMPMMDGIYIYGIHSWVIIMVMIHIIDGIHWWYIISTNNQPFMYGRYTNWYMDLMYGKLAIYWKWYPRHVYKLGGDDGILEQQVLNPRKLTAGS